MNILGQFLSAFKSSKEEMTKTSTTQKNYTSNKNKTEENDNLLRHEDIYYPDISSPKAAEVENIELTEKEAVMFGWSYSKKSKSIRITNYHGEQTEIIVPCKIGGIKVNEIGNCCFAKSKVTSVEMPGSIAKIGNGIFDSRYIKRVIFSDHIRYIPENTFYMCSELEEVHLPLLLNVIGKRAFLHCAKLNYIELPNHLSLVDEEAFFGSGIKGFSISPHKFGKYYKPFYGLRDGSAFHSTPMQRNHKIVAVPDENSNKLNVLTVMNLANIQFPEDTVLTMGKNSINGPCFLDFSKCKSIEFIDTVYWARYDILYRHSSYFCTAVVNKATVNLDFPDYVRAVYPDGTHYKGSLELSKDEENDVLTVKLMNDKLLPSALQTGAERIRLISNKERQYYCCTIHKYAINEKNLKSIDLGIFNSTDEIFSHNCTELHDVSGNINVIWGLLFIDKHIPPSSLLGKRYLGRTVHNELMKSFSYITERNCQHPLYRSAYLHPPGYFYDQTVIDNIFLKGYVITRWKEKIRLNQRDKILISIDILRGKEIYNSGIKEERIMYSDYLKGHRRYAEKVCYEIYAEYPEYADFLLEFFEE